MEGLQRFGGCMTGGGVWASHHLAFHAWLAMMCEGVVELLEGKAFD
jgi:hypothetical protein